MRFNKYLSIVYILSFLIIGCGLENEGDKNPFKQEHIPWPSLADSPWPMFRHDPQGTGRSQHIGPQIGQISFTFNDTFFVESSVAIGEDGILYLTSSGVRESNLYAIKPSGEIYWKKQLVVGSVENYSTPTVSSNGIIYVSSPSSNQSRIHAIRLDGTELWNYLIDDLVLQSIPLDLEGNLYFLTHGTRNLISLTPEGTFRWDLSVPDYFHNGVFPGVFSPDGSMLYVGGNDSLYAITTTGDIVWGYYTSQSVYYSIIDNEGNIYFYNDADSTITCLDPMANVIWKTPSDTLDIHRIIRIAPPTLDREGNLYFIGYPLDGGVNELISLNSVDGSLRWKLIDWFGSYLVIDSESFIYFGGESNISCLSSDGELIWQAITPSKVTYYNGPAISNGGICYFPVWNKILLQIIGVK